jgi:MipA family protein
MLSLPVIHVPATSGLSQRPRATSRALNPLAKRLRTVIAVLGLSALAGPAAWAQDTASAGGIAVGASDNGAESHWGLGLGVGTERALYRDFRNKAQGLPLIYFENRWISILGPSLDIKLPSVGPVSFSLRARYAGEGYESKDSPYLAGMDDRKASLWTGGAATWRTDVLNVTGELLSATGKSKGQKIKLQVDRRFQRGAFDFAPRLAAHWADRKYVDYNYGVRSSEALPQRRAYQGDASVNVELGLSMGYAIAPRQSMFLDISTTHFGRGIKNSPLVDRSSTNGVRLGYMYLF